ncbi:MAG TPA: toll/interleukin-1 receptor domain-containing protein, partial [Caulobacteraceae bacterium]|nr:toll/interleukin-1 receptor domain-containing protein [Caulobacteraceae bacterium]
MSDIFISYAREDRATARRFAEAFEAAGHRVWWDSTLRAGETFDEAIEKALNEAKAVVVLWSPRSVVSRWVRAEATQADRNGTLAPVTIEPCKRPIIFELSHTADLSHWDGSPNDPAWIAFLADVRRLTQGGDEASPSPPPPPFSGEAKRPGRRR